MKPQTEATLRALRIRGREGMTPLEALDWIGTDRLAASIYELREEGYIISRRMVPTPRGTGSHARYVLEEDLPTAMARGQRAVQALTDWAPGEITEVYGK